MAPVRRQLERDRRARESVAILEAPREPKPTLDEIKGRLGPTYGLSAPDVRKLNAEPQINLEDIKGVKDRFRDAVSRSTFNLGRDDF